MQMDVNAGRDKFRHKYHVYMYMNTHAYMLPGSTHQEVLGTSASQ